MPHQIGDSIVSAIEEVELSSSSNSDEVDLASEDSQLLLQGDNTGEEINIQVVIVEDNPNILQSRVDNLKALSENDAIDNYINYQDIEGRISVDSVSVPDSSSIDNLRTGEISGKFLPFPQFYPNQEPVLYLFPESILSKLEIDGELEKLATLNSVLNGELTLSSAINMALSLEGISSHDFVLDSDLSSVLSFSSSSDYTLNVTGNLSGSSFFAGSIESDLSLSATSVVLTYFDGSINASSQIEGSLILSKFLESSFLSKLDLESNINKDIFLDEEITAEMVISADIGLGAGYGSDYGANYGAYVEGYTANYGSEYGG